MKRQDFAAAAAPRPKAGCPKCGQEQLCPCVNCAERNAGNVVWKWTHEKDEKGEEWELIACGNCGYINSPDGWMDIEYEYYKSRGFFGNKP